jgi:hypothetical protein
MRYERRRLTALATMLAALMTILLAVPASASQGMTQISGEAVPVDDCNGQTSLATLQLSGSLEGCWYLTSIEDSRWNPVSGIYQEVGTELFDGCYVRAGEPDVCGTFATTFRFTAQFPPGPEPDFANEIHGRCQHPITAGTGTGDLTGITGRLDFKDDVDAGIFYYRGHLRL